MQQVAGGQVEGRQQVGSRSVSSSQVVVAVNAGQQQLASKGKDQSGDTVSGEHLPPTFFALFSTMLSHLSLSFLVIPGLPHWQIVQELLFERTLTNGSALGSSAFVGLLEMLSNSKTSQQAKEGIWGASSTPKKKHISRYHAEKSTIEFPCGYGANGSGTVLF